MILTPGLTRSSQPLIFLGLPLRTAITTTDWVRMPLVGVFFQLGDTCPLSTRRVTSGSREKCTMSALRPPSTARLWSPEAPYDVSNVTPLPSEVFCPAAGAGLFGSPRVGKPTGLGGPGRPLLAPAGVT